MSNIAIGYSGRVRKGGLPTTLTSEPCSALADDALGRKRYQITNSAKRRLDPATAIVVKEHDPGAPFTTPAVDIANADANSSIITFAVGYTPTAPVTLSGKYIPMADLAFVKEAESSPECNFQEVTQVNQAGYDQFVQTTLKWSGGFTILSGLSDQGLDALIANKTPVFYMHDPDGSGVSLTAGWVLLSKASVKVTGKAANEVPVTFTLYDQSTGATALSGFTVNAAFSTNIT